MPPCQPLLNPRFSFRLDVMKDDHLSTMISRGHASGPEAAAHLEHLSQRVKALEERVDFVTHENAELCAHKEIVAPIAGTTVNALVNMVELAGKHEKEMSELKETIKGSEETFETCDSNLRAIAKALTILGETLSGAESPTVVAGETIRVSANGYCQTLL